jgi:uncharacterized protein YndB with AHSA1/START domain
MRYEHTIDIDAPPQRVWEVMTDVERWPVWTASVTSVKLTERGALRVGARARIQQPRLPAVTWEVTELVPGRSFTWAARSRGAETVASHRIESDSPARSRVTLTIESSGPIARLIAPLISGLTRRYVAMEAQGLKQRSETPAGVSVAD